MASFSAGAFDEAAFSADSFDLDITVVVRKTGGGANPLVYRNFNLTSPEQSIPLDRLVREDEELLAVIIAGVQIGIIK